MADRTGTLWENDGATPVATMALPRSGVHVLYRDVLGLQEVDAVNKTRPTALHRLEAGLVRRAPPDGGRPGGHSGGAKRAANYFTRSLFPPATPSGPRISAACRLSRNKRLLEDAIIERCRFTEQRKKRGRRFKQPTIIPSVDLAFSLSVFREQIDLEMGGRLGHGVATRNRPATPNDRTHP